MTALSWRPTNAALFGERGGLTLYKIIQSESGVRFVLSSYLHGALKAVPIFETVDAAKAYAEVDFADWLARCGLEVRK